MARRVVFLGDSITMGYGLDHAEDRYSTVFCKMEGAKEINYGITGTLMARAGLSKTDGTAFIDRYAAMEAADLAVVFGATNDYFWTDAPIAPEDSEDDRYFLNAVRHLCLGLKGKYPGVPVVFITPPAVLLPAPICAAATSLVPTATGMPSFTPNLSAISLHRVP